MDEKKWIPLSVPNIDHKEVQYVTEALEAQWVSTGGPHIQAFEEAFARYLHIGGACACQSGTAGLHLCLRHFGIGRGDIVLVPTLTFIATINAVCYVEATPMFFDCDDHFCIDVAQLRDYVMNDCEFDGQTLVDKTSGASVKAIIPVHVFGEVCDMEGIMDLAKTYGLVVIEDATESLGSCVIEGIYNGKQSGTIGHAGVFSFNGNKIMTTGGGGMIVTADEKARQHIKYLSQQAKDDEVYFVHNEIGYNYRMTNIQAALGLAQLEKLDTFIQIKKENFKHYERLLQGLGYGQLVPFRQDVTSNHWFYSLKLTDVSGKTRDRLITYMHTKGIQTRPLWKLNHTQEPFKYFKYQDCTKANNLYGSIVNIPCSTNMQEEDVRQVAQALQGFVDGEEGCV